MQEQQGPDLCLWGARHFRFGRSLVHKN